jgi:urease accessory protein UreH
MNAGWHGKLNLVYAQRGGITQLIHSQHQAPLKVQRPFYPEGEQVCHSVILHTAGGVVGGDRLSIDLHLEDNARTLITTAAAGKIYRSNGLQARQNIEIEVNAGAGVEWLPQETIIFDGAIYRQDLRVELALGATWLGWEITRFGRSARGERFCSGEWRSHTEIWQQGHPLWIETALATRKRRNLQQSSRLGRTGSCRQSRLGGTIGVIGNCRKGAKLVARTTPPSRCPPGYRLGYCVAIVVVLPPRRENGLQTSGICCVYLLANVLPVYLEFGRFERTTSGIENAEEFEGN